MTDHHLWLVTVRAKDDEVSEGRVRQIISEKIMPLVKSNPDTLDSRLAKCINCKGEYTGLASWKGDAEGLQSFEKSLLYAQAISELSEYLRMPPKRDLWEIVDTKNGKKIIED